MRKVLLLFALLFCITSYAQELGPPPPPGCYVLTIVDDNNDGFAPFDLDAYFIQFRSDALTVGTGFDLSGYVIQFYPSETDYIQGTNLITSSPYTNVVGSQQFCYMELVYSGSGPFYNQMDLDYYFSCHKLVVTPALATISNPKSSFLHVYPNPVSGILYINGSHNAEFLIAIFDLNGKVLIEKENPATIDISQLKSGIYLVNMVSKGKRFSQKITVVH